MKYIVHKKGTPLTPAAQAIRDIFSIKLTRAKERHAEAMGFNSFNHLSQFIKQETVESPLSEYIERLTFSLDKNHKIGLTSEQMSEIENRLSIEVEKGDDEYFIQRSRTCLTYSEYEQLEKLKIEKNINIIFVEEEYIECGYVDEYKRLINGDTTLFVCLESLSHGYKYTNGIFFLVSKEPIEFFKISSYFMFDFYSTVSYPIILNQADEFEDQFDLYNFIEFFRDYISAAEEESVNLTKKNGGTLFPTILTEKHDFFTAIKAIENNIISFEVGDYDSINGHIFSSTVNINEERTYVELKSLNLVYLDLFNSEFLEAYSIFYKSLIDEFKEARDKLYVEFFDYAEDYSGAVDPYVYFSNIRDFKDPEGSINIIECNTNDITLKVLRELFELNGVESINAHSAIKHDCGGDMIMGCSAFDKTGLSVMKFQIFIASDYHFYDTFLDKFKEETGIKKFKVTKHFEYNLTAPVAEIEDGYEINTFSYPEDNQDPTQLAFLIYKFEDYTSIIDGTSVDLASNVNVIPYIEDNRFRDAVIGKPLFLPTDQKQWYQRTHSLIEKLKQSKIFSMFNLNQMMVSEFQNEVQNSEFLIMGSPVIFNLPEDDFSEMLMRYHYYNESSPSFKKVDEMSKAINVDIQDYMLIVGNPNYVHY